jgi:hypothetical protein
VCSKWNLDTGFNSSSAADEAVVTQGLQREIEQTVAAMPEGQLGMHLADLRSAAQ